MAKVNETIRVYKNLAPIKSATVRMMSGRQQIVFSGSPNRIPKGIADRTVMARVRLGNEVLLWITTKN